MASLHALSFTNSITFFPKLRTTSFIADGILIYRKVVRKVIGVGANEVVLLNIIYFEKSAKRKIAPWSKCFLFLYSTNFIFYEVTGINKHIL